LNVAYLPNLKFVALPVPEVIAIAIVGLGLPTPNLGEREAVGVTDGTVRRSVGEFLLALHSNFSSIFTRFSDIAAFVLQHATFSHPHLYSPQNFPMSP